MHRDGRIATVMSAADIEALVAGNAIQGDVLPQVVIALEAVRHGVKSAHIIDGRVANALLLEVLTSEGVGTTIGSDEGPHFLADSRQYLAM